MKIFLAEFQKNYETYSFGYAPYCLMEHKDEIPEIYNRGFLPYSANIGLTPQLFYMARSLRCDLDRFSDSSENKRVGRKVEELKITLLLHDKSKYVGDEYYKQFCMEYVYQRFSNSSMDQTRFEYVMKRDIGSHVFEFRKGELPIGYVYVVMYGDSLHYWFSFFDLEYLNSYSIGKWMMWQVLKWAKTAGCKYVYLGTCYGTHSLYKVRDFKGLEYWDGTHWNKDMPLLKQLCKTDNKIDNQDQFKLSVDQESFLQSL